MLRGTVGGDICLPCWRKSHHDELMPGSLNTKILRDEQIPVEYILQVFSVLTMGQKYYVVTEHINIQLLIARRKKYSHSKIEKTCREGRLGECDHTKM